MQCGASPATPFVLFARPTGTRGIASDFFAWPEERPRIREICAPLLEEIGMQPHDPRRGGDDKVLALVLIDGLHRLEACKALGEETIEGFIVRARLH